MQRVPSLQVSHANSDVPRANQTPKGSGKEKPTIQTPCVAGHQPIQTLTKKQNKKTPSEASPRVSPDFKTNQPAAPRLGAVLLCQEPLLQTQPGEGLGNWREKLRPGKAKGKPGERRKSGETQGETQGKHREGSQKEEKQRETT